MKEEIQRALGAARPHSGVLHGKRVMAAAEHRANRREAGRVNCRWSTAWSRPMPSVPAARRRRAVSNASPAASGSPIRRRALPSLRGKARESGVRTSFPGRERGNAREGLPKTRRGGTPRAGAKHFDMRMSALGAKFGVHFDTRSDLGSGRHRERRTGVANTNANIATNSPIKDRQFRSDALAILAFRIAAGRDRAMAPKEANRLAARRVGATPSPRADNASRYACLSARLEADGRVSTYASRFSGRRACARDLVGGEQRRQQIRRAA